MKIWMEDIEMMSNVLFDGKNTSNGIIRLYLPDEEEQRTQGFPGVVQRTVVTKEFEDIPYSNVEYGDSDDFTFETEREDAVALLNEYIRIHFGHVLEHCSWGVKVVA